MILTETFIIEDAELLIETRKGKTTRILRGVFGRCDEKNNNGRVYRKPILEREVMRLEEAMRERRLLGELDHPTHDSVKLSNVSHLITNLGFKGNDLVGECELLDTPAGKVAQALIEGGVRVGISSRGMGTLTHGIDGSKQVNEDYKLVTFDLVADPSTRGAYPNLAESAQSEIVEEIVKTTLETAAKEKVFTTLLKEKLRTLNVPDNTVSKSKDKTGTKKNRPTAEDPFRGYEDFRTFSAYPNTGRPCVRVPRGYADAETVTTPSPVVENMFKTLKTVIIETKEMGGGSGRQGEGLEGQPATPYPKKTRTKRGSRNPHAGEPEEWATRRQANQVASDIASGASPSHAGNRNRRQGNYGSGYSSRTRGRRRGDTGGLHP